MLSRRNLLTFGSGVALLTVVSRGIFNYRRGAMTSSATDFFVKSQHESKQEMRPHMIDQEFKTDETKQLELLNRGIEDVQRQLIRIDAETLTGMRKSLAAIDSHNFEARLVGWVQIALLALILWRIW